MRSCSSCGQPVFVVGEGGEKIKCLRCRSRFMALSRSKDLPFGRFTHGEGSRVSPFSARTAALLFALLAVAGVLSWLSVRMDKPRSRFEEAAASSSLSQGAPASKGLGPVEIIWTRPRDKTAPPSSAPSASSAPAPSSAPIRLSLDRVSAQRRSSGDIFFECEASLINTTGAALATQTNFSSVFDGISIVIQNDRGDLLHEQSYIYHQSPYAEDQRVDLPAGTTQKRIVFPVSAWDAGTPGELRVHLKGGLRGTKYSSGLVSNELSLRVKE